MFGKKEIVRLIDGSTIRRIMKDCYYLCGAKEPPRLFGDFVKDGEWRRAECSDSDGTFLCRGEWREVPKGN